MPTTPPNDSAAGSTQQDPAPPQDHRPSQSLSLAPPHRRYLRVIVFLLVALAVLVGVLAFALSEVPALARGPGAQMVGKLLGRPVTLERMRIDPFSLHVHIDGLQIGEATRQQGFMGPVRRVTAGGAGAAAGAGEGAGSGSGGGSGGVADKAESTPPPFASLGAFDVTLSPASLIHGYPIVSSVRADRLSVHLARDIHGRLNVQDLMDRFLKAPSKGPTPALVLRDVVLHDGALTWDDGVTGAHHGLTGMELALPWFSTREDDADKPVAPQFYGHLDERLLVLYGNAAAKDRAEALTVHFEVEDLHLPDYTDLVPVPGQLQLRDGRFDARMDAHVRIQPGALPQVSLAGDFILRDLDVRDTAEAGQPMLALQRLEVPVREYRMSDGLLHLGQLSVRGFRVHAGRAADGTIDWVSMLQRVEASRTKADATDQKAGKVDQAHQGGEPGKAGGGVRHLLLDGIDFAGGEASWDDLATGTPVHLELREATLKVGAVRWPDADHTPFQLSLQGDRQEQIVLDGTLSTPGPALKARATLTRIDLQRVSPYFAGELPVRVDSSPFSTAADLELGLDVQKPDAQKADAKAPYARIHGLQFSLPSVAVHDREHDALLVHVHDLQIHDLEADSRTGVLSIGTLDWSALETGQQVGTAAARFTQLSANRLQKQAHIGTLDITGLRLPADGHGAILHADGIDADLPAQRYAMHSVAAADLALPTGLSVGAVRAANAVAELADGHYHADQLNAAAVAAPGDNRLGGLTLTNADVRLARQHLAQLGSLNAVDLALGGRIKLALLEANSSKVDLDQHTFSLDLLHLADLQTDVLRERDGAINTGTLMKALDGIPGYQAAPATSAATSRTAANDTRTLGGWQGKLGQLKVDNASGSLRDETHMPAATARWQQVQILLTQLSTQAVDPARFSLTGQVNRGTQITLKGHIRAAPLDGKLHLTVAQDFAQPEWQTWLPPGVPLQIRQGGLNLDARLQLSGTLAAPQWVLDGSAALSTIVLAATGDTQALLSWKRLASDGVHVTSQPLDVHLQHVQLDGLNASLQLEPDGSINLTRVLAGKPASSKGLVLAPASGAVVTPPLPLTIDTIDLNDAQLDFQDHFVKPEYAAHLNHVDGKLTGLSSRPESRGKLTLAGTLDGGASVTVAGLLNPLASPLFLDLQSQVHDFELGPLTSYSTRFTGFPITRGKLSFDIAYKLDHGKITAGNHLRLDQLTLGDRKDIPGIKAIPMDMAVNLLKDSNGVIEVDLPIEGTLADPQFNLGGIIGQLVSRAVERAVTAPFRWLGSLFGGEHAENFGWVGFAAGSDALDSVAVDKLQHLALALTSKPALSVDIRAYADAVRDLAALSAQARTNPDAISELSARRMRAAQDWLTGPGKIEPGRVFVAGDDAGSADQAATPAAAAAAPSRVQFTLH